ncbi:hypothetical protein [Planctomicrobium sp. SH664]|uniref:hypothetical protein n=1 Tax=Planctomicrobium sp. SH664 TaxID=3448125 RepID=UPI003F5C7DD8
MADEAQALEFLFVLSSAFHSPRHHQEELLATGTDGRKSVLQTVLQKPIAQDRISVQQSAFGERSGTQPIVNRKRAAKLQKSCENSSNTAEEKKAERGRFELPVPCGTPVFKTGAAMLQTSMEKGVVDSRIAVLQAGLQNPTAFPTLSASTDSRLIRIVESWESLPEPIRAGIMALVVASGK